jgi:hypothetical protein
VPWVWVSGPGCKRAIAFSTVSSLGCTYQAEIPMVEWPAMRHNVQTSHPD